MADNLEIDGDDRPVTSQDPRLRPSARKRWLRRTLTIAIALGALGGFGVIVFNAYDRGDAPADDSSAPVIKAETGPTKVRPQTPGGMEVPNQDKQVFGRIAPGDGRPQIERLIPPPEATVARPPPPPEPVAPPPPPAAARAPAPAPVPAPAQQATTAEPAARSEAPAPAPAAAPHQPPPQAPPKAATAPEPAKAEPPKAPSKTAAKSPPPQAAQPRRAASGYRVQIAALRSEDAAKRAWARLSKRHPDLFGKLDSRVVRADLGAKGVYWRLQAGPLASAEAARALCDRAKQRKLGCIVVRP